MLASGSDDSLVLVWDLLNSANGAVVNAENGGPGLGGQAGGVKGPAASWRCDHEIGNLSWAPQSGLTAQGGEWVGVAGGRGIWTVKL
jgi:DDB1- and CUL4-associated factor 7